MSRRRAIFALPMAQALLAGSRSSLETWGDAGGVTMNEPLPSSGDLRVMHAALTSMLAPAGFDVALGFVSKMTLQIKAPSTIADFDAYKEAMAEDLAGYPIDVLRAMLPFTRRRHDWLPSVREALAICEELMQPRRLALQGLTFAEREHERREKEAARQAESERQEREAETALRLAMVEKFGAAAPAPGDLEAARDAIADLFGALEAWAMWRPAIKACEPWAVEAARFICITGRALAFHKASRLGLAQLRDLVTVATADEARAREILSELAAPTAPDNMTSADDGADALASVMDLVREHYRVIAGRPVEIAQRLSGRARPLELQPIGAELLRRVRAETAGFRLKDANDPAIAREFAAPSGVAGDAVARGVGELAVGVVHAAEASARQRSG